MIRMRIVRKPLREVEIAVFLRAQHHVITLLRRPARHIAAPPAEDDGIRRKRVFQRLVPHADTPTLRGKIRFKTAHQPPLERNLVRQALRAKPTLASGAVLPELRLHLVAAKMDDRRGEECAHLVQHTLVEFQGLVAADTDHGVAVTRFRFVEPCRDIRALQGGTRFQEGAAMARDLDFRHHGDAAFGCIRHNLAHVVLRIKIRAVERDVRVRPPFRPDAPPFVRVAHRRHGGQFGIPLDLDAPALVVHQMPVEDVVVARGHAVEDPLDSLLAEKMACLVEQNPPPGKARVVQERPDAPDEIRRQFRREPVDVRQHGLPRPVAVSQVFCKVGGIGRNRRARLPVRLPTVRQVHGKMDRHQERLELLRQRIDARELALEPAQPRRRLLRVRRQCQLHDRLAHAILRRRLDDHREIGGVILPRDFCAIHLDGQRRGEQRELERVGPLARRNRHARALAHHLRLPEIRRIVRVVAVVLVDFTFAHIRARRDKQHKVVRAGGGEVFHGVGIHRDDRARLDEPRIVLDPVFAADDASPVDQVARRNVVPLPLREPDVDLADAFRLVHRLRDRRGEDAVAEQVGVGHVVGGLLRGPVVVEGPAHRNARIIRFARRRVDVGCQAVPEADRLAQNEKVVGELPDAPLDARILGAVRLENRREYAALEPAREEFAVKPGAVHRIHVAGDVVPPVAVADVRGRRRKPRNHLQHAPRDLAVAREANLVAVRAETAPAVVDEGTLRAAVALGGMRREQMVQPKRIAQRRLVFRHAPLLPVQPPEVDAFGLHRGQDVFKIARRPLFLVAMVRHGVRALPAVVLRECVVAGLDRLDAARGMEIERRLATVVVQILERRLVVGEQALVPGVARPAPVLSKLVLQVGTVADAPRVMPLHVDDEDVDGDVDGLHLVDQLPDLRVRVEPVAAPPVAERPAGR